MEHLDDVLQVPVQAIIEHGSKHYCVLRDGEGFKAQQVTIGPSNDKRMVIEKGLQEGQQVVLNAGKYREEVGLAKSPDEAEEDAGNGPAGGRPSQPGGKKKPEGSPSPAQAFKKMDRNGDGKLQKDELPGQFKAMFATADTNKDGAIDRAELGAVMAKLRSGAGRQGHPPGAGP